MSETKEIEVLKTALLLEKRGRAFYQRVAQDTESQAVRSLFALLAEEEGKHVEYLSKQFASFSATGQFLEQEPTEDAHSAVQDILSSEIRRQISAASYEAAAISAAIEMENRAVAVYTGRAEASAEPREKSLYIWLAQWEKGHLRFLAEINDELLEEVWYQSSFWPF
ncbi:MAG: ferritin family protein [Spirochaetaceae bacterium]|nr:MAG: ferritin family protein [Spirochaetaceae bacterium]